MSIVTEDIATEVELVQIAVEAEWEYTVPRSRLNDWDVDPEDEEQLNGFLRENSDDVLNAMDLALVQGDDVFKVGFAGINEYEGVPEATTEWPERDWLAEGPYFEPVPSHVSRYNLAEGKSVDESPVTQWNDDRVIGGIMSLEFAFNFCSIGERQKSHLMPFFNELLHAMYARPTLHNFVASEADKDLCGYCSQVEDNHTRPETTDVTAD